MHRQSRFVEADLEGRRTNDFVFHPGEDACLLALGNRFNANENVCWNLVATILCGFLLEGDLQNWLDLGESTDSAGSFVITHNTSIIMRVTYETAVRQCDMTWTLYP